MRLKVIIFGAWKTGITLYFELDGKQDVIAFSDNNKQLWGQYIYDKKIISPDELTDIQYDYIYIASNYGYRDIYMQLCLMGIEEDKIKIITTKSNIEKDLNVYAENALGEEDYEPKWMELTGKYGQLSLFRLDLSGIGETVPRMHAVVEDSAFCSSDEFRVFIPDLRQDKRICNTEILHLIKDIYIVDRKEIKFWKWVLENHFSEINTKDYNKYLYRGHKQPQLFKERLFTFSKEQVKMGETKLMKMKIKDPFVCMINRSSNYVKSTVSNIPYRDYNIRAHEYRNSDFGEYSSTIQFLKRNGILTVRMGRGEEPIPPIDNCIDYAGLYADDFMDFYLLSKCKFMISTTTGIFTVAAAFGKPILMVNVVGAISFGFGGMKYIQNDLYIPKKYYDNHRKAYLSLKEIAQIEQLALNEGMAYEKNGIKFTDNTKEEILDATEEMLLRLEGQWQDTEEDIKYYDKYKQLIKEINILSKGNKKNWLGEGIPYRISARYLRNNLYLLD